MNQVPVNPKQIQYGKSNLLPLDNKNSLGHPAHTQDLRPSQVLTAILLTKGGFQTKYLIFLHQFGPLIALFSTKYTGPIV